MPQSDNKIPRKRHLALLLLVGPVAFAVCLFALKLAIEFEARTAARSMFERIDRRQEDIDAVAIELTTKVHQAFAAPAAISRVPLTLRMRPYLSHRFIPAPFRVQPGAIDTIYLNGDCDSAARALTFLLAEFGFKADQLNLVTPIGGHSAVLAEGPSGRLMLLDPYYGAVPFLNERILGPRQLQELLRAGEKLDQIMRRLAQTANIDLYNRFADAKFAKQGSPLEIDAVVKLSDGQPFQLGRADGSGEDVTATASAAGLTPYWNYIGSRYDRHWVRNLHFAQATKMTIALTEAVRGGLITSKQTPQISGRQLVYLLRAGETLSFVDGNTSFDWLRFRSYQEVDYIRFEPN